MPENGAQANSNRPGSLFVTYSRQVDCYSLAMPYLPIPKRREPTARALNDWAEEDLCGHVAASSWCCRSFAVSPS